MKLLEYVDPFFDRQPPLEFINELKEPVHISAPENWGRRNAEKDEADLRGGVKVVKEFEDPDGLLDTAYADFQRFLSIHDIEGGSYPVRIVFAPTECFEAYTIAAGPTECVISAADTEGIRRALVYFEDEMLRRDGPYLPLKPISRKPFIKRRITRCFFSPTNRPPKNGEELADDIDYYPEEYLNRLAHEGINGVWIYTLFRDLLPSTIIPEYGKDYRRRIDKLNRTIEKCKRYGIKVFVFGVEPGSTYWNPELLKSHRDMLGSKWAEEYYALCLGTEKGAAFAEEATRTLFTLAPDLGGLISITVGESCSHCASNGPEVNCPICGKKHANEVLAEAESILARGMHSVKPDAEFISWRYGQRTWGKEKVIESASCIGDDTILMQNFEDLGEEEQVGRKRLAIDYFLSYAGPSEMFAGSAKAARAAGKRVFAKIQVCNSHEVASVPYVPVPGILYEKYKAMRELGVDGALQCWYFGNYPSIMNKAASELSFEPFFVDDKEGFLRHLAGIFWGSQTDDIVRAWNFFEEGYKNFPINVGFTWYGPMHDGPVWPLQLIPKNLPLAGTWLTYEAVGGDRIGECLMCGHKLEEAITLCDIMSANWKKGADILAQAPAGSSRTRLEQISVASALDCQFESGLNILKFYQLRERLGTGGVRPEARDILEEMRCIVLREIEISQRLKALCEKDKRLGYHSEAEGYKYFPEKLDWRVDQLRQLLDTEFVTVAERIEAGKVPFEYYYATDTTDQKYNLSNGSVDNAAAERFVFEDGSVDPDTSWSASADEENLYFRVQCRHFQDTDRIALNTEFRPMWPYPPLYIMADGSKELSFAFYFSLYRERLTRELDKWQVQIERDSDTWTANITIKRSDFDLDGSLHPFRFNVEQVGAQTSKWVFSGQYCNRLIFNTDHTEMGWLIPQV